MPPALADCLDEAPWLVRHRPFRHVVSGAVFRPEVAAQIAQAVRRLVDEAAGLRHFGWYDAYGWSFPPEPGWPLDLFLGRDWHDLLAAHAQVPADGWVAGGVHHHPPGTARGFVHNDLNPAYFLGPGPVPPGRTRLPGHSAVSYTHGTVLVEGARPLPTVRSAALLYYTANGSWADGDGGETGLFTTQAADLPLARVPPLDNSALLFACTPGSFHTFMANRRERNSIIMWLHADRDVMVRRHGASSLVPFATHP